MNAGIVDGYIHFWESTKIRLKPGILAVFPCHTPRKGDGHGAPGHGCGEDLKGGIFIYYEVR